MLGKELLVESNIKVIPTIKNIDDVHYLFKEQKKRRRKDENQSKARYKNY
jgi:hypothetical protein